MRRMPFTCWRPRLNPNPKSKPPPFTKSILGVAAVVIGWSFLGTIHTSEYPAKTKGLALFDDTSNLLSQYQLKARGREWSVRQTLARLLRIFQLFLIFLPPILLSPLVLFKATEDIWYSVFVNSVEMAGVVWIKCFQYLSHRRDIIGQKMADRFMHLREKSPQHSLEATQDIFLKEFNMRMEEVLDNFDPQPIGTGSVGQVYQAVYEGKKVAVKVRHPRVEKNIERDIDMIFLISRVLCKVSNFFEIPVTSDSMKKVLINQLDFSVEARNLIQFKAEFLNSDEVRFPQPIVAREAVLIQEFVEGLPVTYYSHHFTPFNKQIARIGAGSFFEMLMVNNFIHADMHAGNILVTIEDFSLTPWEQVIDRVNVIKRWFEAKYVHFFQASEVLKELYRDNQQEEDDVRRTMRETGKKAVVTFIDVGMVLTMKPAEQQKFVQFVESYVEKRPHDCAEMIFKMSMFKGHMIQYLPRTEHFKRYYQKLEELFLELTKGNIKDIQGLIILQGLLESVRQFGMSLEGDLATLLTNMLIIEQIGRDVNPDINLFATSVPYFKTHILK